MSDPYKKLDRLISKIQNIRDRIPQTEERI